MRIWSWPVFGVLTAGLVASAVLISPATAHQPTPHPKQGPGGFVTPLTHNDMLASTVPTNGDVNPYGVAVVPISRGKLVAGDVLVSNYNSAPTAAAGGGVAGAGTSLVEISPSGAKTVFAQVPQSKAPAGVGLTTALVVLHSGWVIVGSLPTTDGTPATMRSGGLMVLDSNGQVRETITAADIAGPWDATAVDLGDVAEVFVSTDLTGIVNGKPAMTTKGQVVRLVLDTHGTKPTVISNTVVATGFAVHTDPAALLLGPTGLALGHNGTLYVADTVNSRIAAVPDAFFRTTPANAGAAASTVLAGAPLNGPLGLAMAPNGDLLTTNAADNNLVELTRTGTVVTTRDLDAGDPPGGALFGLAASAKPAAVYYVNDDKNMLDLLH